MPLVRPTARCTQRPVLVRSACKVIRPLPNHENVLPVLWHVTSAAFECKDGKADVEKCPKTPGKCDSSNWKGDKNCDDDNNKCACDWDGGDCCGKSKKLFAFLFFTNLLLFGPVCEHVCKRSLLIRYKKCVQVLDLPFICNHDRMELE